MTTKREGLTTPDLRWQEYQRRKCGEADRIGSSIPTERPGDFRDTADGWLALMLRGDAETLRRASQREQTAATILAAMIAQTGPNFSDVPTAVKLADALREALSRERP